MLTKLLGEKVVSKIIFVLYLAIAFGLPFNKIVLSLGTLLATFICLLDFDFKLYKERIKGNKALFFLLLFLVFHLLSIFWIDNYDFFLKDLNSKLPFYVLPFILLFKPLQSKKEKHSVLAIFLFSLTLFSGINFALFFSKENHELLDVRDMSHFISHIRFGLMLILGLLISIFWLKSKELKYKMIPLFLSIWFLIYTYFSEVFSSYLALILLFIVGIFMLILKSKRRKILLSFYISFLTLGLIAVVYLIYMLLPQNKLPLAKNLPLKTAEGNYYLHDLNSHYFVSGNHVYTNTCPYELTREWEKVSKHKVLEKNAYGFEYYFVLVNYMSSKGLMKDAEGFKKLTAQDIQNIEDGISRADNRNSGFLKRMETLLDEFSDDNPNGKTMKQRLEFWKAGSAIFLKHPFIGVGSGDLQDAFDKEYILQHSKLYPENRLRTHNQIFTYFISFGLFGGLIFCYFLFNAFTFFIQKKNQLALLFLILIFVSFLSEDTLETQMGATFFGFFFGFFLNFKPNSTTHEEN